MSHVGGLGRRLVQGMPLLDASDCFDPKLRDSWLYVQLRPYITTYKSLRSQTDGQRVVYCYTEHCQYERMWDHVTRQCRGLVVGPDGNVLARPFPKFFNVGEPSCPALPDDGYELFEKVDGTLGIWWFDPFEQDWKVATKCSFDNAYTRYAQRYAHLLAPYPKEWTVLTEIVLPPGTDDMPRAVTHGQGLHPLGAVVTATGEDIDPKVVSGAWMGEWTPKHHPHTIAEALAHAQEHDGTEGWVVRYADGLRAKIKTAWYLRLFRAIHQMTEARIREVMRTPGWLEAFPEELRDEAKGIAGELARRALVRRLEINQAYFELHHPDRKTFALRIQNHPDRAFMFMLYDGKDIEGKVLATC